MAATYRTSAAGGGTSGTTNRTVTITPAVGDLLICFAALSGNTGWSPTMTDDNPSSAGWALVGVCRWSASANLMACWVRKALMANTTSTIITAVTGSNTAGELVVVAYSGMTRVGINAIRQWGGQENQAASGTPTPALPFACITGNPTLWAVASGDTTTSPNASWTERQDVSQATPTTALEVATRDSGFTGTSVAAAATQSTVFASMLVELDSSSTGLGIALCSGAQRLVGTPTSGTQATPAVDTAASGSSFLVGMARGNWATASPTEPSDNKGNTYSLIDVDHGYTGFPDSRMAVYRSEFANGGSGHTFSANFGSFDVPATTGDEITLFGIELTGNAVFETSNHVTRSGAASITTGNVTTAGAALLVAVVWGTNNVGVTHFFHETPSQGWSKLVESSFEGDPGGGYIQVCVFVKQVFTAGTYSGTFFTQNSEGAEIDLVAFRIGSASYTASPSETVTLSEAIGAVAARIAGIGETVALSEATDASRGTTGATAETVNLSESLAGVRAAVVAPAETVNLSDAIGASMSATAAPTETVPLSEGAAGGIQLTAAVSETVTIGESLSALCARLVSAVETITLVEAVGAVRSAVVSPSETVALVEQIGGLSAFAAALADSVLLEESASTGGSTIYTGNVGETVAWLESVAVRVDAMAVLVDAINLADGIAGLAQVAAIVAEAVALGEALGASIGGGTSAHLPIASVFLADDVIFARWVRDEIACIFVEDP